MKEIIQEIVYVLKTLDKSTQIKLILMTVATIALSIFFIKTIDNPVYERWKEEREVTQQIKERQEEREQRFLYEEELEEVNNKDTEEGKEHLEGVEEVDELDKKEPEF